MKKSKQLICMVIGFTYYMVTILRYGGYKGFQRLHRIAQKDSNSLSKTIILGFLDSPLGVLFREHEFVKENKDRDQLTANIIKEYSDYDVGGYANLDLLDLGTQQRGLIVPLLEETVANVEDKTIVEIGTANGDILGYLAELYSENAFVGVDFNIDKAKDKWCDNDNMWFWPGYALDMLESGDLTGDILFASSTFCLFAPKELTRYMAAISKAGFKRIVLNEPCWSGYEQTTDGQVISKHVTQSLWYHNYAGYFSQAGYDIDHFEFFSYRPLTSTRPDIHVLLIRGQKE